MMERDYIISCTPGMFACSTLSFIVYSIETMLSFSMELCRTVIGLLTGTVRAIEPISIDDPEKTLTMARLGSAYQQNLPDEIYEKM